MPEYLLTGRDAKGRTTTERVEAGSADDAVMIARGALGLSDVVLHTDDASAFYQRQKDVAEVISPRDYLRLRDLPTPIARFLIVAKAIYGRLLWLIVLGMLLIVVPQYARGEPWGRVIGTAAFLLLAPGIAAGVTQFSVGRVGDRYTRMLDAAAWGRGEEVLRRCEELKGSKVPPEELAFQKATALAGLGRLEEGLAVVAPYGDGAAMPEWLHLTRLSDVHVRARRFDDARDALNRAAEIAPENPTVLIDVALFEIRHRRDVRRAREFLERARTHALSDVVAVFADWIDGQIAREEGRAREAVERLEDARRRLSAFRHASPIVGVSLDLLEADLALALAAAGEPDAALRHARAAMPRLRALNADPLVDRLRAALGPAVEG